MSKANKSEVVYSSPEREELDARTTSFFLVTPRWAISSDEHQCIICEVIDKRGDKFLKPKGYYGTITRCVQELYLYLNRTSPYSNIQELIDNQNANLKAISNALSKAGFDFNFSDIKRKS